MQGVSASRLFPSHNTQEAALLTPLYTSTPHSCCRKPQGLRTLDLRSVQAPLLLPFTIWITSSMRRSSERMPMWLAPWNDLSVAVSPSLQAPKAAFP